MRLKSCATCRFFVPHEDDVGKPMEEWRNGTGSCSFMPMWRDVDAFAHVCSQHKPEPTAGRTVGLALWYLVWVGVGVLHFVRGEDVAGLLAVLIAEFGTWSRSKR